MYHLDIMLFIVTHFLQDQRKANVLWASTFSTVLAMVFYNKNEEGYWWKVECHLSGSSKGRQYCL